MKWFKLNACHDTQSEKYQIIYLLNALVVMTEAKIFIFRILSQQMFNALRYEANMP